MIPFSIINLVPPGAIEPIQIGCISNDDCPDHAACRNSACINPCALDNPCAPNANCKVLMHEPVCTCPDGYIGSPLTECKLRKYRYGWVHLGLRNCGHSFDKFRLKRVEKMSMNFKFCVTKLCLVGGLSNK